MNKNAAGVVSRLAGFIKYKYISTDCTDLPSPVIKQTMYAHSNISNTKSGRLASSFSLAYMIFKMNVVILFYISNLL